MTAASTSAAAPLPEPDEAVADSVAIAAWLDVPVGTVKRWAQADNWPRQHSTTSRGRRTEYSVRAASATYHRLRGGDTGEQPGPTGGQLVAE